MVWTALSGIGALALALATAGSVFVAWRTLNEYRQEQRRRRAPFLSIEIGSFSMDEPTRTLCIQGAELENIGFGPGLTIALEAYHDGHVMTLTRDSHPSTLGVGQRSSCSFSWSGLSFPADGTLLSPVEIRMDATSMDGLRVLQPIHVFWKRDDRGNYSIDRQVPGPVTFKSKGRPARDRGIGCWVAAIFRAGRARPVGR